MADETPEKSTSEKAPTPPARGKLMPALLGANGLLLVGVLGALFLRKPAAPAAEPRHAEEKHAAKAEASEHKAEGSEHKEGSGEKAEGSEHKAGGHGSAASEEEVHASSAALPMLKLPEFIVHLHDADVDHYARITFELQVESERDKTAIEGRVPQVRDAFLGYLSDRTADDLRGSEGLEKMKGALTERLPRVVPGVKVAAIYVTDLVVQ